MDMLELSLTNTYLMASVIIISWREVSNTYAFGLLPVGYLAHISVVHMQYGATGRDVFSGPSLAMIVC